MSLSAVAGWLFLAVMAVILWIDFYGAWRRHRRFRAIQSEQQQARQERRLQEWTR